MDTLSYKTRSANKSNIKREWHVIDATNVVAGRLASKAAHILRGKNKPYYTPHVDCGDFVIVINADKVRFTGKKLTDKKYISHTGYPGGQKEATPKSLINRGQSEKVIESAIRGMLPKNRLGRDMFRKLFVYAGSEHPHKAQQPKSIKL